MLTPIAPPPILPSVCDGRLTLTSGVPVLTSNVTSAGTLYWTPYGGNRVALYDGSQWVLHSFTELSLALSITSGTLYDVFVYDNSGTLTLELAAWTNNTTRATALATQDGVLVKSTDATRRYLGTLRASGTNTCEDSDTKRFLFNHYHRARRKLTKTESTANWTTSNDAWESLNASTANRVEMVIGVVGPAVRLTHQLAAASPESNSFPIVGIGYDSTSTNSADLTQFAAAQAHTHQISAQLLHYPAVGYHYYQALQRASGGNTVTFYSNPLSGVTAAGLIGEVEL